MAQFYAFHFGGRQSSLKIKDPLSNFEAPQKGPVLYVSKNNRRNVNSALFHNYPKFCYELSKTPNTININLFISYPGLIYLLLIHIITFRDSLILKIEFDTVTDDQFGQ